MNLDREMELALQADGEKLRQLTGEDHGPFRPFAHSVDWQFHRVDAEEEEYLIEVLIRYDIEPFVPAQTYGPPEDCSPAEGGCVDALAAFKPGTDEEIELTADERKEVSDWIEQHHDHEADRRGDPDAAYEAWRDDQMDWGGEDW